MSENCDETPCPLEEGGTCADCEHEARYKIIHEGNLFDEIEVIPGQYALDWHLTQIDKITREVNEQKKISKD